jgi:hypothetical protein
MNMVYVVESNIRNMDWAEVPRVGGPPDEILTPESSSYFTGLVEKSFPLFGSCTNPLV